jgi:uncharacterized protein YjbI with pentapeptide repeats
MDNTAVASQLAVRQCKCDDRAMRLPRAAAWRTASLFSGAALIAFAQHVGWSRIGHGFGAITGSVGRWMWPVVTVGWPFLLAAAVALLVSARGWAILSGFTAKLGHRLKLRGWPVIVAAVLGVLGLLLMVLVLAPPWFVHDRSLDGLKAQNEVRATLLQGLGGVVLLVGAYFTYRQVVNGRRQLQIALQGQITERFTRAIDQLGHAQVDIRLGGIYALERIAYDSSADRPTIREVLTAFVRSHAPWPPSLPGQYVATAPMAEVPELEVRAPDVQACLKVLDRGGFAHPEGHDDRLDLHAADLRHAHLQNVNLKRANLLKSNLGGANLVEAHLEAAVLSDARLEAADLFHANLEGANLRGAHLERASLRGATLKGANLLQTNLRGADLLAAGLDGTHLFQTNLEGAKLRGAFLKGSSFTEANLRGSGLQGAELIGAKFAFTHLDGADLRGAHLEDATFFFSSMKDAIAADDTVWPTGFDWQEAGVIMTRREIEPR